jgi:Spy/CpxP family protein refolding chaperone
MRNVSKVVLGGLLVTSLAVWGFVGSTALLAQVPPDPTAPPARGGRMGGMGPMGPGAAGGRWGALQLGYALGQLGLSDDQRTQIQGIMQQHRDEFRGLRERAQAARRALDAAVTAPTLNEGAVRAAAASWAEVETDMAVARARVHADVWQGLTPEQRTKAEQLRAQRQERIRQRGNAYRERFKAQAPPQQ